jgi:hypothetical protein
LGGYLHAPLLQVGGALEPKRHVKQCSRPKHTTEVSLWCAADSRARLPFTLGVAANLAGRDVLNPALFLATRGLRRVLRSTIQDAPSVVNA